MHLPNPKIVLSQVRKPTPKGTFNVAIAIGPDQCNLPAKNERIASRNEDLCSSIMDVTSSKDRRGSVQLEGVGAGHVLNLRHQI